MESKIKMENKILIERHQDDETKKNESFKKYIFKNLNFSIINGLRRTIISDIPVRILYFPRREDYTLAMPALEGGTG